MMAMPSVTTLCAGLLLTLLLPATLVSGRECCRKDSARKVVPMVLLNDSFYCWDKDLDPSELDGASAYRYCSKIQVKDPTDPSENFVENEDKTEYSLNGEEFLKMYCTGPFTHVSQSDNKFTRFYGKELLLICADDELPEKHHTLYATCILISCVFLLLTLLIYLLIPELRDLQGKCVMCSILSLMIGYLFLAYLHLPSTTPSIDNEIECVVTAFLTYFWILSAFFWLNINSFNVWRSTVLSHISMSETKLMRYYHIAGWGLPLVFLLVALVTHHLPGENIIRPNFGVQTCWFDDKLEYWSYFYGPVSVLLVWNIFYFIHTALYLRSNYHDPNPLPRFQAIRNRFCLYLKLFLIMGITWIFEILSSFYGRWYVTDIINCLQGVIIFVVMILLRKRVWRLLAATTVCGISLPHCWERIEDDGEVENIEVTAEIQPM